MPNQLAPVAMADLPDSVRALTVRPGSPRILGTHPQGVLLACSQSLEGLTGLVGIVRENWRSTLPEWSFTLLEPAWVILVATGQHALELDPAWEPSRLAVLTGWIGLARVDQARVFVRHHAAGRVQIPGHPHLNDSGYGTINHLVILARERPTEQPDASLSGSAEAVLAACSRVERVVLATASQEVEVQTMPFVRVSAWRVEGGPSWCAPVTDPLRGGIRTWIMDPVQTAKSPQPGLMPGTAILDPGIDCTVSSATDPTTALALRWHLACRDRRLILRHGLSNHGRSNRTVALWSLMVVPQEPGWMCLVAGAQGLEGPWLVGRNIPDRSVRPDPSDAVVGTSAGIAWRIGAVGDPERKLGVKARDGWTALVPDAVARRDPQGRRLVLLSRISAQPAGDFPEGDLNLTSYRKSAFSELEHVGPLVDLAPGATTWLEQELRIVALETDPGPDPVAILAAVADAARITSSVPLGRGASRSDGLVWDSGL